MRKNMIAVMLLLIIPSLVFGAGNFEDLAKYYPMKKGFQWIYSNGETVTITDYSDGDSGGYTFEHKLSGYIRNDVYQYVGDTVSKTMSGNVLTGEMSPAIPIEIMLKNPVTVGTMWQIKSGGLSEKSTITKVLPFIKVQAGKFNNVVVVETVKYLNNRGLAGQIKFYAPGVGLIKLEEPISFEMDSVGKRKKIKELIKYKSVN